MKRAVENIRTARSALSDSLARHILEPATSGEENNVTYALWAHKPPFPSDRRIPRNIARWRYGGPVLNWNAAITRETLQKANPGVVLADLQAVHDNVKFPTPLRQDAFLAMERVEKGQWQPQNCLQHGDFWCSNILLATQPDDPPFYIIDWAGMQSDGTPFLDLARMLISLRSRPRFSAAHIEKLREIVACEPIDVTSDLPSETSLSLM